jgi:hypothetical protein
MENEARFFLRELFGNKPEELYLLLWTLADKRSRWFRDVDESAKAAKALRQQDVYVGVGLSPEDFGPTHRCPSDKVAGIVGLWADLDLKSEAHSQKSLPRSVEEALSIIPREVPPTIVVTSGNGAHAWWLFKEPFIFDSPDERCRATKLILRWQTLLRLNAASRGWAFDRLADLARVLRVPGTFNNKDPNNRKPVSIHSRFDRRCNPSDLEDYLDDLSIPDPEEQERAVRAWSEQAADKPLVLDLNAGLPEELLQRFMELDLRFKNTWLRQRPDLKDQSQSGYDMALADFGCEAGLSDQQIVDMIVHHRRIHDQGQRTRLDYFQRTLSKARNRLASPAPLAVEAERPAAPPADPTGGADSPQPADAVQAKALLCEQLSNILGIRILRILKITGKEPTYQVELENATLEFLNVGKLIDQNSLRLTIAAGVDRLIPKIKAKHWERVAQMLLAALTVTEGGEETDLRGSIKLYVDHYLSETSFIDTIEGQPIHALRKPTVINGQIAICSSDLQPHINKTFSQNLSVKAVASMLAAIGATSVRVQGARFREQSRWLLPVAEFDPAHYLASAEETKHATRA